MKPIILTGFMGAGKTTIGKVLARRLRKNFVDLDSFFTQQSGLSPPFYIKRFGIRPFRKLETLLLRKILENPPEILSVGGGAVLESANRHLMLRRGFVVWLDLPFALLLARLHRRVLRPMLPKPFSRLGLKGLLEMRKPFYQQCHFHCFNAFALPKEVANRIVQRYIHHHAS